MVRLFLDGHLSGRRIGRQLRAQGHDVRVVDEERDLDGLDDPALFLLAVTDERVLVTANVRDFIPILREWAEGGRVHAGCIVIPASIPQDRFGLIAAGLFALFADQPEQRDWRDQVRWLPNVGR